MKETAVLLGESRSLVGVLTDPSPGGAARARPAVLLLNAGLLHRVGPHRVYVRIARRLAAAGYPVLRFDYSSIGDSAPRRDELSVEESALRETRAAMDFLAATRGAERFVLLGLCAGAENAFPVAREDPRVVGAVMIDGYAYRTPGYYVRYLFHRLFRARSWRHLLTGKSQWRRGVRMLLAGAGSAPGEAPDPLLPRAFPPKAKVLADLKELIARGTSLYFIYSGGGMEEFYNYESQFAHAFPSLDLKDRVSVDFFQEADHLFTRLAYQDRLVASVEGWMKMTFGAD
jgi:dienelactone hydrolase